MLRTVADFTFAIELLEALINDDFSRGTTLVVCSTRKAFLRQIAPAILTPQTEEPRASQAEGPDEAKARPPEPVAHRFLSSTLGLLAAEKAVRLAFCPSVKSLRAYLSTYTAPSRTSPPCETSKVCNLVIVDLVLLHRDGPDFSVQGLSRSFACAVEAAARNGMNLRLVECKDFFDSHDMDRGYDLWNKQVPLLSNSVRLGGDGVNWAGRSISVKTVVSRWMTFEKRQEVARDVGASEEEEMLV